MTDLKKGVTIFEFYNGDIWVSLTKQTGEFFAPKTLQHLERLISAASKPKCEIPTDLQMESIPLEELWSLVEDIHVKT